MRGENDLRLIAFPCTSCSNRGANEPTLRTREAQQCDRAPINAELLPTRRVVETRKNGGPATMLRDSIERKRREAARLLHASDAEELRKESGDVRTLRSGLDHERLFGRALRQERNFIGPAPKPCASWANRAYGAERRQKWREVPGRYVPK